MGLRGRELVEGLAGVGVGLSWDGLAWCGWRGNASWLEALGCGSPICSDSVAGFGSLSGDDRSWILRRHHSELWHRHWLSSSVVDP